MTEWTTELTVNGDGHTIEYCGTRRLWYNKTSGSYSISENEVWIPGSYADRETALAAFEYDDLVLLAAQNAVNEREPDFDKRVITMADLIATEAA